MLSYDRVSEKTALKPMSVDFTVAIPTYNGQDRLPDVLERLRSQTNTEQIVWEVLVIDNNSSDNTAKVVREYQSHWPSDYPLRYCFEPQQGLAFSRQRAVQEARGKLIGFLDDDNLPTSTWVSAAYTFGENHPKVGGYGSRIYGDLQGTPPKNFEKIACLLAIADRGSNPLYYEPQKKLLPPGAGLVVRRQVWLESVPKNFILHGRIGDNMLAGEDLEALLHIQQAGWEIWYNPEMCIYHRIPYWRLEKDYLIKLCRGIGLSRHRTRMLSVKPWQRPLVFFMYMFNDLRKILFHLIKYKFSLKDDIVAACQMELFINSLISPFYLWKTQLRTERIKIN